MKRIVSLAVAAAALFALSGCGGGDGDSLVTKTWYIEYYDTGRNIEYVCLSGTTGTITVDDGSFKFDFDGDQCDFDLHENLVRGNIYLNDEFYNPVNGIVYTCEKPFGNILVDDVTGPDGLIDNATDYYRCTLYLPPQ